MEKWAQHRGACYPEQLSVLGSVMISLCTRNAIRCSILDLLTTLSMRRLVKLFYANQMAKDMPEVCWKAFLEDGANEIIRQWDENPKF